MLYKNANVFIDGNFKKTNISTENGIITSVSDNEEKGTNESVTDCEGRFIIPALVDIHTHGCKGYDFSTASEAQIGEMLEYYALRGIGTVLSTVMTNSRDVMLRASETAGKYMAMQNNGGSGKARARLGGVYMEGPFFKEKKKGAHDARFLTGLDAGFLSEFDSASGGNTKVVAFDPCLEGAGEFVCENKSRFTLSLAHTDCSYKLACGMMDKGVAHVTHMFNAMNGLDKREPGIPGAVFDHDECYAEIICDGIHIHPSVIRAAFKAHGDRMVLISDSMAAAGLPEGEYELGGLKVVAKDGRATLADGTLAGSVCDLRTMLERAVSFGVPLEQAVAAATVNPAKSVGIDDVCGVIKVGRRANFVFLDM